MTITFSRRRGRKVNKNDDGGNNNQNAASASPSLSSRCQTHQIGVSVTTFLSSEEEKERNTDEKVSVKPFSDFEYKGRWASTSISISSCRHPYPKRRRSEPKIPRKAVTGVEVTNNSVLNLAKVSLSALEEQEVYRISNEDYKIMGREFFECDALELAPKLLGKLIRKDDVILQITEVEAYRQNDTACHGRFGITARTAPVFGPGGHSYVYLCYGLHIMLNVVADKEGVGAAVLIRSCAPISGLETIQSRRGQSTNKPVLLTGPGKVGQALGLTMEWSNHPLYIRGGLEVLDGPAPEKILVGPRVGIEYASPEDVQALWRFAIAGTAWISAPRNTLRPA